MSEVKLGIRAINVLKNLGIKTPADLDAQAQATGQSIPVYLLRIPNCGRKTLKEITEWYHAGRPLPFPAVVWVRIDRDYDGSWRVYSVSNEPRNEPTWHRARIEQNGTET